MTSLQKIGAAIAAGFLFFSFRKSGFASPVAGFDIRDCDPHGCGYYGASRKRDGVSVPGAHNGIDVVVQPGEEVYAPISGKVRTLFVYSGFTQMKGIEITSDNMKLKMFYVSPVDLQTGDIIVRGEFVGYAQDIASYHNAASMTPHIHVELYIDGVAVDPTDYF